MSLVARDRDRLTTLSAHLREEGIQATEHAGDVTDEASLTRALAEIGPVDVLLYSGPRSPPPGSARGKSRGNS